MQFFVPKDADVNLILFTPPMEERRKKGIQSNRRTTCAKWHNARFTSHTPYVFRRSLWFSGLCGITKDSTAYLLVLTITGRLGVWGNGVGGGGSVTPTAGHKVTDSLPHREGGPIPHARDGSGGGQLGDSAHVTPLVGRQLALMRCDSEALLNDSQCGLIMPAGQVGLTQR